MDTPDLRRFALGMVIANWRERIRKITHGKRLSQRDLERAAQLPIGSVFRFEGGKDAPDPEQLRRIGEVFGIDGAELLREEELMYDLLVQALGPLRLSEAYEPKPPEASDITDHPLSASLPADLRRRWERLIAGETRLAQERYVLEYETAFHASRSGAGTSTP